MPWTEFWDMHSGGGRKLDWDFIYIEAPLAEARAIFYSLFGRNPERVTCTCCGEDYALEEYETLEEATAYQRGYYFKDGEELPLIRELHYSLDMFVALPSIKIVYANEISDEMRKAFVPSEGYVWV